MRRREFISLIGGAALWPRIANAQTPIRTVGVLTSNIPGDWGAQSRVQALRQGLADLGWVENTNLILDVRYPGPDLARQQHNARELIAMAPDVIVATSTPTARALRDLTRTIPIVFVGLSDPVTTGIVSNLAHPDANVTGFTLYEHTMAGKWLALLKDMAPQLSSIAVLFNPDTAAYAPFYFRYAQASGERLGLRVTAASVRDTATLASAISAAGDGRGGLVVLPDGGFFAQNSAIAISLAARYRVPAIYSVRFYAANGGLMSYGADLTSQFRDGAVYVDRILRGASPRELPVQFATSFELVINMRVAGALGLTVPPRLLVDAQLIE
jgi:putative ABC transport system substrate-binding protein